MKLCIVTFFYFLGQIVTKKSNIINLLEKINLFERIYVLGFIHFQPIQGLSAKSVIHSSHATQFQG